MPTLQFKGKNIIWNHHLSIPYHALDEVDKLHYKSDKANGNIIIEGDNLLSLKALLPQYSSRIKSIYIDPPYNTGDDSSEGKGWIYNDNVNSPLIREWLGKEVGRDDLTKHDKWLCMMTPRLKILRELLSEDGAIFISIHNIELSNLKSILDEIFGENNFVGILIWRKKEGGGQTDEFFVTEHEYIITYRKTEKFEWYDELIENGDSGYKLEDENGKYKLVKLAKWGNAARKIDRPKMHFPIIAPDGSKVHPIAPDGSEGRWRVGKKTMDELIDDDLVEFKKDDNGKWLAYEKIYYEEGEVKVIKERSILYHLANTGDGTKVLTELFSEKDKFPNPKPVELIKWIFTYSTQKDSIVLDSFAGSGTTMHAIMDLNKEDSGNRQCILVQMTEATDAEPKKNICKDITRERIKRAIDKYGYNSGFNYYRIGIPIDAESLLSGKLPTFKQFAEYVYYLCTGEHIKDKSVINEKTYLVGSINNSVIYLVYKQNFDELTRLALNLPLAEKIIADNPRKKIIVYAPACFLEEDYMKDNNIEFVGIPYNLFRRENGA